jgi:AhpD family alkylhydroperoxidase
MSSRVDYAKIAPGALKAMFGIESYVRASGLEHSLLLLLKLRASYINGCAYCVDMHSKDARAEGETEQRIYSVPVWRETPFYTPRERAALEWCEVLTTMATTGVPDEARERVKEHFTDLEVVNLTMNVVAINGWNRIAVGLGADVGSYQPQPHPSHAAEGAAA